MAHLTLKLLGPFRTKLDTDLVSGLRSSRLQALLAYLAVEADREHERRTLAEMIWPNRLEGEALAALRYALSNLRTAIGDREADPPFLHITRSTLRFNTDSDYTLDVERFQRQIAAAEETSDERLAVDALRSAVDLYRGTFLESLLLPDAMAFEEWLLYRREMLTRKMASALQHLATAHERAGAYREAQAWAERWLRVEPWNETAHQQMMRALVLNDQRAQALTQYETCCRCLDRELGVEPGRATQALYQTIREGQAIAPARQAKTSPVDLPAAPNVPFVTRENELAQLDRLLDQTLAGQGRVAFLTGEAGSGKTALWRAFTRRAMEAHGGLVVAAGQSSDRVGVGDPYLPFREILQTLAGDVEPQRAGGMITSYHARRLWAIFPTTTQLLVTYGPDLIGHFVPGRLLLSRFEAFAPSGSSWFSPLREVVEAAGGERRTPGDHQAALFEQVTAVLRHLAQHHPLMLVLDDLQWADEGSISLLFHLGKRLTDSRILIVGAYRPGDLVQRGDRRHPLKPVVNEFRRDFGEVRIDLDQTPARAFVDAYLDTEPNRLGEPFREALARHTGGNPLFTGQMMRVLQECGGLVQDKAGRWIADEDLNWDLLPAQVEAVVAERMQRLSPQARRLLSIASVSGETFVAEVLARVEGIDEIEVFRQLKEPLSEQHRLVHLQRVERWPNDEQRISTYQFRHILFQTFFYHQLDEMERIHLHERLGMAIEAICAGDRDHLACQASRLAYHFQQAGAVRKAIQYRQQAGEQAVRLSANEEAIYHFNQGLELIETLPATARRDAQEMQLLLALGVPLQAARGYGAPEVGRTYDRALALCWRLGDMPEVRPVLWLLGSFYTVRAEYEKALKVYTHSLQLAEKTGYTLWVALARWARGSTLMYRGHLRRAAEDLEYMVEQYDPEQHHTLTHQLGQDPGVDSLTYSAWTLWFLGYPDQALERSRRAVALANALDHPLTQAFALGVNGVLHQICRSWQAVSQTIDRMSPIVEEGELPFYDISLSYLRGLLRAREGEAWLGLQEMEQALAAWEATGTEMHRPHLMAWLAEAYGQAGEVERGLALIDGALRLAKAHNEGYFKAEMHRLRGELLVMAGDETGAEANFRLAITVAQEQEAKSWEMRATISLSRLWQRQGKRRTAFRYLKDIYDWFSEGFETHDLREARSLLSELSKADGQARPTRLPGVPGTGPFFVI